MKLKRISIILILLMLSTACFAQGVWPITNANVSNPSRLRRLLENRIGTLDDQMAETLTRLNKGTGEYFYVDSGKSNATTIDGKSWIKAEPTLEAVFAGGELTANNNDWVFINAGHEENLSTADGADCDVAGVTVYGIGNGADAPEFTYTLAAGEFVVGAANIYLYNLRFIAATSSITMGISVEADGDNCTMDLCVFPKPTTNSWEFLITVDLASGADGFTMINCEGYNDEAGAAPNYFIYAGNGVNNDLTIVNNKIRGDFAVSAIWSNKADDEVMIAFNMISNQTAGQHCIEFTSTAKGFCLFNQLYSSTEADTLDPGSLECHGNTVSTALDRDAVPIPATAGVKRYISKLATASDDNLFDVDGGPILITDFYGLVTTQIGATPITCEINLDADSGWVDYDFSTAVSIVSQSAGDRIVFTAANESVLTPLNGADGGATNLFKSWLCGEGMIEQNMSVTDNTGAIRWYMEYITLTAGVTVTAAD